ncbi:class I SAM-dependent methyltransferase [Cohnella caldifontis]|uniref:class I SAM-dependent methyltransferase n=1 Tax=Cohnella caldifontis TaxID=3027471 RepID=UPI0023EB4F76|nr:class I SAM-dependent methyltransferase [Cohnella sp. YIM B05605]
MKFEKFLRNIKYAPVQPNTPLEEIANTTLPDDDEFYKRTLYELCTTVPKLSTFGLAAIINRAVSQMPKEQAYVNVGVWHGFSFLAGMIHNPDKKCIGIDNFTQFGSPRDEFLARFNKYKSDNHYFYDMDYVDFFRSFQDRIGFYFYDGEHSYENQLKGLQLAEPFFAKDCIVMVDDTNWEAPRRATLDFVSASPYQYSVLLSESHPTFWNGVMILRKEN